MIERLNTLLAFLSYALMLYCCLIVGWHVLGEYVWLAVVAWSYALFLTILFVSSVRRCVRGGLSLSHMFLSNPVADAILYLVIVLYMWFFKNEGWDDLFFVASYWILLDLVRQKINSYTDGLKQE